jgi:hypothetical protein
MTESSSRFGLGLLAGVVIGFLLAGGMFGRRFLQPAGLPSIGVPDMSFLLVGMLFVTLWIVLIAVAIRWLFNPRGHGTGRLADLPADFDDWHRRAHAQMDREAAGPTV